MKLVFKSYNQAILTRKKSMFEKIQKEWLSNIQKDLLSGFVVGLSVIPETAGFAIMVGLDVGVAFYTTFYMAFVLSFFWG